MSFSDTYTTPSESDSLNDESRVSSIKYKWLRDHARQFERSPKPISLRPSGQAELISRELRSEHAELMGGRALKETDRAFETRDLQIDDLMSPGERARLAEASRQAEVKKEQIKSSEVAYTLGRAVRYARDEKLKRYLFNDN